MDEVEIDEIARKGLYNMGKHPILSNHCYLGMSMADKSLNDIDILESYPNLMYVDVSNNSIESLDVLKNLPALVQLNASNNRVTDCLTFHPPCCNANHAWSTGHTNAGSFLTLVNLSHNMIETFNSSMNNHPYIECLLVSNNRISSISYLNNLIYLQVVDLSYNKLTRIAGLDDLIIQELNLEGNQITSLHGLNKLPRLSVLNISNNYVSSLSPLSECHQLTNINVKSNNIEHIRQVEFLSGLKWLSYLYLAENPCCSKKSYRYRVIYRLSNTLQLDSTLISSEDKIRAMNLYEHADGDLMARQEIFYKHLPNEHFQSANSDFIDDEVDIGIDMLLDNSISNTNAACIEVTDDVIVDSNVISEGILHDNMAFVFIKPHANNKKVQQLVNEKFNEYNISIVFEGVLTGEEIDEGKLIDQHYYAIASKATLVKPADMPVPKDKFFDNFGITFDDALTQNIVFNALDACAYLQVESIVLNEAWLKAKLVKLGGGFYVGLCEVEGKTPIYVFNAFFLQMRNKFVAPGTSIHYYSVEWSSSTLSWADFRGKVLGPTDPALAPVGSLRNCIYSDWESLGLQSIPNVGDNGVHASASPFEGLAERMNWLKVDAVDDPFGCRLLNEIGMSVDRIKEWSIDPQINGKSLFDQLEDRNANECIEIIQSLLIA